MSNTTRGRRPSHYLFLGTNPNNRSSHSRTCRQCGRTAPAVETKLGAPDVGWCDQHAPAGLPVLVWDPATETVRVA